MTGSTVATVTVAGQADIRQRLNADGLAALGQTSPLLAPVWTQAAPSVSVGSLSFTVSAPWFAPVAGILIPIGNGHELGLSLLDGSAAVGSGVACEVLRIHPQARLRIERLMVATLQTAGSNPVDRSIRPVPSLILITNPTPVQSVPLTVIAGEQVMPAGTVRMFDEHGLIVDPFSFAAALDVLITGAAVLGTPMPGAAPLGTLAAFAQAAGAGQFVHAVDLHGRPWQNPPGGGIGIYSGAAGNRVKVDDINDGALHSVATGNVVAVQANANDTAAGPTMPGLVHLGLHTTGTMGVAALTWPGGALPARDTLRLVVCDPGFHLLGNRSAATRDGVGKADTVTIAEDRPLLREGSALALLPDGRSMLGFVNSVVLGLQGGNPNAPFTSGPIFATSVAYDAADWPFPVSPGPAGAWPVSPAAVPVAGSKGDVLGKLAALRQGGIAKWVSGTNNVQVTLPPLPLGVHVRLFPIQILLSVSPDEQPLLRRADGPGILVGGTDTLTLIDPFGLGAAPARPADAELRMDAIISWVAGIGAVPQVVMVANLNWSVGSDVAAAAAVAPNILGALFWRSRATNPMLGAPPRGPFPLTALLGDPIAFMRQTARALSTDTNPREAPRLPTMSRNESLFCLQLPAAMAPDLYRAALFGSWLTSESDSAALRLGNPGGAGRHEVHAPGVSAGGQLGFDLWVAAAHRARPIVPTVDAGAALGSGPNATVPANWALLQANALSAPPGPPAVPSTLSAAVLQTVSAFVETPELALIPTDNTQDAVDWVTNELGSWVSTPNDPELHRQIGREIRSAKYGRRDTQWALRRALRHARELVYIETPLLGATSAAAGGPVDTEAAVDLIAELAARLTAEPALRVVILVPRELPFATGYEPFSMYHFAARRLAAQTLQLAAGDTDGLNNRRPRVVVAHPVGAPGRPVVIRSTTIIVDDVWCLTGASSFSRRGLTFDGSNDVVLTDYNLDRGAGVAIRAHRKALMGLHLGVGAAPVGGGAAPSPVGAPAADWVRLHQPVSAHETIADVLISGGRGKLLPLWNGPDPNAPDAVIAHPASVADPDGRAGASFITTLIAALGGNNVV